MTKSYQIRIQGKVQGVFYRHSAQTEAKRLGLAGIARNESGGSVYIEAEGSEETLKQFVEWCNEGPASADVSNVEFSEQKPKNYPGFSIL